MFNLKAKVFASVLTIGILGTCANAQSSLKSNIEFVKGTGENKNIFIVYNKSDYELKNFRPSKGIVCNKNALMPGEISECNATSSILGNFSTLSGLLYKIENLKKVKVQNFNFESANLDGWEKEKRVFVGDDDIKGKEGNFYAIIEKSQNISNKLTQILEIEKGVIYKLELLATQENNSNLNKIKSGKIAILYLDKNKKQIAHYFSQKFIENTIEDGFKKYVLALPKAPQEAKYIQIAIISGDEDVYIDNIALYIATDKQKYKRVFAISKSDENIKSFGVEALCNTCDGKVGDFVWNDLDKDGYQDDNEPGIPGVKVYAIKDGKIVKSTVTDSNGYYHFCKLCKGNYKFKFVLPKGWKFTKYTKGFDAHGSSAHSDGYTDTLYVYATYRFCNVDAGAYKVPVSKPGIDIEKYTNGVDADSGTGPIVKVGSEVTWKYIVKNTGNVKLYEVYVNDDKEHLISCPKTTLNPGEVMTCYKKGIAKKGQYVNKGRVVGKDAEGRWVKDEDYSHYYGKINWNCPAGFIKFINPYDKKLYDGATTYLDVSNEFKNKLKGPSKIIIKRAYTWDGYSGRKNHTNQKNEQVRVVFVDDSNHKYLTPYTKDLEDGVDYAEALSDLGTINLPNGAKKVIIAHIANDKYGSGNHSSPNSLYFEGFCYQIIDKSKPAIDIEKYTNGIDADSAPGAVVAVGSKVTWKYVVKNIGNVVLTNIEVKDNKEGSVCTIASLAPGASKTCTKTGTAKEGQYENEAVVTAKDPQGNSVSDKDLSHYYGKIPNNASLGDYIWYDKNANGIQDPNEHGIEHVKVHLYKDGVDTGKVVYTNSNGKYEFINLAPGKYQIKVDKPKNYPYFTLQNVGDDNKDSDVNPSNGLSDPINLKSGQHCTNLDAGLVCRACSKIDIEKYTNGEDADTGTGPIVTVGNQVVWKYVVKNIGNTKLTNVVVKDDKEGIITCPKTSLEPGESMTCIKKGKAKKGQYENVAIVTAKPPVGKSVSDKDPSHYYGGQPHIDIEKSTNGQDADTGTGPIVAVGSTVTWKYVVKNIGNVRLTNVKVTDNKEGAISCPKTTLNPGESMTCTKTGTAKAGQYTNEAIVTGKDPQGNSVSDKDPSHYYGKKGACVGDFVWLDKNANGIQDSGESGIAGVKVEITDENGNSVKDIEGNSVEAQITGSNGKYKFCKLNDGKYIIKITPPNGYVVSPKDQGRDDNKDSDIDPATHKTPVVTLHDGDNDMKWDGGLYMSKPLIDIEKYTNGKDADNIQNAPKIKVGEEVEWKYVVKNIGNVKLTNIVVKDDKEGSISCSKNMLLPNESMTCIKKGVAKEGEYENKAVVKAKDVNGKSVEDKDLSHYIGKKALCIGDFIWEDSNHNGIQDKNEKGIKNIKVRLVDANGNKVKDIYGNEVKPLLTNEKGEYRFCNLEKGKYKVVVTIPNGYVATLKDKGNDERKDSDLNSNGYTDVIDLQKNDYDEDGGLVKIKSKIDIEKYTNGIDADSAPGAIVAVGSKVTWKYVVKNIGNVVLKNIVVKDNKEGIICTIGSLNPNESKSCIKTGIAKTGQYENEAIVTAKDLLGHSVSDKDKSHYFGKKLSCIGDLVWFDKNANGIQDSNEQGIAGVKVELLDENENPAKDGYGNVISPQITNSKGEYKFCHLNAGKYILKITPPKEYVITEQNRGGDDEKDSDFDPKSKKTTLINLGVNSSDLSWDAGLYKGACIGNFVWEDIDGNGIQDSGEVPISGVKVSLMDMNGNSVKDIYGNEVSMQITQNDGKYQFCNLKPGQYKVKIFKDDPLYYVTYKNKGNDESKDSDIDPDNYTSDVVILESGEVNNDVDGGYFRCGSLVGVYSIIGMNAYSTNIDLSGLKVKVVDEYGNIIAEKETDKNGEVHFDNLLPGKYHLEYEKKEGLTFKVKGDVKNFKRENLIKNEKEIEKANIEIQAKPKVERKSANALNLLFVFGMIIGLSVFGYRKK